MTIITHTNSGITRRCDATCHHAKYDRCNCICGGRYHRAGDQAQTMLTRDYFGAEWPRLKTQLETDGGTIAVEVRAGLLHVSEEAARG